MSKQSAIGIVVTENKILLMHRVNKGHEYYSYAGGGREEGESLEETVVREIEEETTVKIKPNRLIYKVTWDTGDENYFYLCEYISGVPRLNESSEEYEEMKKGLQVYDPQWVDISCLSELLIFPLEVRDLIIADLKTGFKHEVQEVYIKKEERRREL